MKPRKAQAEPLILLNGLWEIEPGTADAIPVRFGHKVSVPGLVDMAQPGYSWKMLDYHWYKKTFTIDSSQKKAFVFLKIDQSQFGTVVYVNGKKVGSSISCYTSQEYRIEKLIRWQSKNDVVIRVGGKSTLPPETAVGKDMEKEDFTPGIWGDVSLRVTGNPRIKRVQVIPRIRESIAETRIWVENLSPRPVSAILATVVQEKKSGKKASKQTRKTITLKASATGCFVIRHKITRAKLWSPDDPFLYEHRTELLRTRKKLESLNTTFGMREFIVNGKGFSLNGKQIFLRGSNIAFHRFLSDKERGSLPWDGSWIKRVLIDIPKAHNFNFFRNHLGQMYNAWYDIADEHGMLLQNEWQFWGTTGTPEQITKEFTEWLQDNWNHPSIVIWDPLNESTDDVVQKEIVPRMKTLDPTRPWESVDFVEEHPYIYSLGPVLNDRRFGFTRSLLEIESSKVPTMVNEFVWWWANSEGEPTPLMKGVVERWLGSPYSKEQFLEHQSFLAQELVELFRRMRVNAIQPFVYLSNNEGATAHWFKKPTSELRPKPILDTLRNAFSPFGISIELWDRHFVRGERRSIDLFIFNDQSVSRKGEVTYGITNRQGEWVSKSAVAVSVSPSDVSKCSINVEFPRHAGEFRVHAELQGENGALLAKSTKRAFVISNDEELRLSGKKILVLENSGELSKFLRDKGAEVEPLGSTSLEGTNVVILSHGEIASNDYAKRRQEVSELVREGRSLIVVEPEFGVPDTATYELLDGLSLEVRRREDVDRGGYDSYIFASDLTHPLWRGIDGEHLKIFNGAYGGEVVSQHDVLPNLTPIVHSRCGLGLQTPVVMELAFGKGKVIISRPQLRNRIGIPDLPQGLYSRRIDAVLQKFFTNLVFYACEMKVAKTKSTGEALRAVKP